ncbi:MAG TPA: NTP transferase domain-containing protein [Gammaproteobacteria bacterium]|nr:NTP transferase domain-containing protein [Gammaproteobacteria bacterium]
MSGPNQTEARTVGLIVLATNPWLRLGGRRRGAHYRWKTLLLETVEAARVSRCRPVVVVLGNWAAGVRDEIGLPNERDKFKLVVNWAWREGISSSIRQGLTTLEGLPVDIGGVVIARAGSLSAREVNRLVDAHDAGQGPVVVPDYWRDYSSGDMPALFSRSLFPELMGLRGAQDASDIVRRHAPQPDSTFHISHRHLLSGNIHEHHHESAANSSLRRTGSDDHRGSAGSAAAGR